MVRKSESTMKKNQFIYTSKIKNFNIMIMLIFNFRLHNYDIIKN